MTDDLSRDAALISRFDEHCQGSRDQNRYFLALNVSAAKVPARFSHPGSSNLDDICAFDLAETAQMNLGQLNLIRVSSFCGPDGIIWGYDVARPNGLGTEPLFSLHDGVPVYDGHPIMGAAAELFGSVDRPRFPIMPGSHTMAAYKSVASRGPSIIYSAFGLGIPKDRNAHAAILMEDVGTVPKLGKMSRRAWRKDLLRALSESVAVVAANQRAECASIFVLYKELTVSNGEVGCAISLAPYFAIARKAVPESKLALLRGTSLEGWRQATTPAP